MGSLVVVIQAEISPISEGEKFRQLFSSSSTTTFNYNQNFFQGGF
jgi:hypothetical protein